MNRTLALGLALLAALCAVAAFSDRLAPHEQGYSKSVTMSVVDGETVIVTAPEPPGRNFALGSDFWGRDIMSEMIRGLPWTLGIVFAVSLARCVLGLALGVAMRGSLRLREGRRGFSPLAAMPGFIIAAFALYPVTINSPLPRVVLFALQAAVLTFVEFMPLASSFAAKADAVLRMPFVEAARVSGAGPLQLARRHLLPFLAVDFLEAVPVQGVAVAAMIGKLGIVKIFIGGTTKSYDPPILNTATSEWLGLLGHYYEYALTKPWLFLGPFCGWVIVLACLLLLSSGLRVAFARSRRAAALER